MPIERSIKPTCIQMLRTPGKWTVLAAFCHKIASTRAHVRLQNSIATMHARGSSTNMLQISLETYETFIFRCLMFFFPRVFVYFVWHEFQVYFFQDMKKLDWFYKVFALRISQENESKTLGKRPLQSFKLFPPYPILGNLHMGVSINCHK